MSSSAFIEVVNKSVNASFPNTVENDVVIYTGSSNQSIHIGCVSGSNSMLRVTNSNVELGGYIVQSACPVFFAHGSSQSTAVPASPGTTLILNATTVNRTSSYNTSTGIFTAPVAGIYQFILKVTFANSSVDTNVACRIVANGSNYEVAGLQVTGFAGSIVNEVKVQLAANSTVRTEVWSTYAATFGFSSARTSFSGHLMC
jgi:hypothetical protein